MSRPTFPLGIRAFVLAFGALLVCVSSSQAQEEGDPQKYLDVIVDVNTKLKDAGFKLGLALGPLYQEKEPDAGKLDEALANAQKTYKEAAEGIKTAKPPKGAEAEALQKAHAAFMAGQDKIVNQQFKDLVASAKDDKKPLEERKLALDQGLQQVTETEKESLEPLIAAFTAYVEKYDLKTPGGDE